MNTTSPILIVGGKGKTGARVNALLQLQGLATRAVSRSTTPSFDWQKPDTWREALAGVKQAYVTYQPDLAVPEAHHTLRAFIEAAREAGIEHLVLLSGRGEDGAILAEKILIDSGLTWNVVRASWFFQNFSESFLTASIESGELSLPVGDVLEPFIDCDDIAEVAVAALTNPALSNQLFEVTGPELLTFADCVAEIARQTGRPIRYRTVPLAPFLEQLKAQGLSADELWLLKELFTQVLDGRNSQITHGVEQALGRTPRRFADFVAGACRDNAWPALETQSA